MQKQYEAPELKVMGEAHDLILGILGSFGDMNTQAAADFEFEQD